MSDFEPYSVDSSLPPFDASEAIVQELPARGESPVEREGLPRTYQMRADKHYVDGLESHTAPPAIRMIPIRQIEVTPPLASIDLDAMVRSIAANGIVQPLLVRRHSGAFQLIAGRKRLAAAIACRLAEVPCLVHEADVRAAAALAAAENVRSIEVPEGADSPSASVTMSDLLPELLNDLGRISGSAALLKDTPSGSFLQPRVVADLIQTQAGRTLWLLNASALLSGEAAVGTPASIGSIFERVVAGLESEARLRGLKFRLTVTPSASASALEHHVAVVAITGAVLITLAWLDQAPDPRIELHADAPHPPGIRVEITQRAVRVPPDTARGCLNPDVRPVGNLSCWLAARILKRSTADVGGTAEVMPIKGGGSVIQCTFIPRPVV